MSEPELGIEVPEEDRLEQLQDAGPGIGLDDYEPDDLPTVDADSANPADVLEQQVAVPEIEDEVEDDR